MGQIIVIKLVHMDINSALPFLGFQTGQQIYLPSKKANSQKGQPPTISQQSNLQRHWLAITSNKHSNLGLPLWQNFEMNININSFTHSFIHPFIHSLELLLNSKIR